MHVPDVESPKRGGGGRVKEVVRQRTGTWGAFYISNDKGKNFWLRSRSGEDQPTECVSQAVNPVRRNGTDTLTSEKDR